MPKIVHHDLHTLLPDEWWQASQMPSFVRRTDSYCHEPGASVLLLRIEDIEPVRRSVGIFREDIEKNLSAEARTSNILRAIRNEQELPPIVVHLRAFGAASGRRSLYDGTHRLYCSIASGFPLIPAIETSELPVGLGIDHRALKNCPHCGQQVIIYSGRTPTVTHPERNCPWCSVEISVPGTVVVMIERFSR